MHSEPYGKEDRDAFGGGLRMEVYIYDLIISLIIVFSGMGILALCSGFFALVTEGKKGLIEWFKDEF